MSAKACPSTAACGHCAAARAACKAAYSAGNKVWWRAPARHAKQRQQQQQQQQQLSLWELFPHTNEHPHWQPRAATVLPSSTPSLVYRALQHPSHTQGRARELLHWLLGACICMAAHGDSSRHDSKGGFVTCPCCTECCAAGHSLSPSLILPLSTITSNGGKQGKAVDRSMLGRHPGKHQHTSRQRQALVRKSKATRGGTGWGKAVGVGQSSLCTGVHGSNA